MDRVAQLKDFLRATPQDAFLQHALALEYVKLGKNEEAKVLFDSLLTRDPGYVGSYYHLGKTLERLGRLPEAIQIYKKGMQVAREAGESHAAAELRNALEDAEDLLEDLPE